MRWTQERIAEVGRLKKEGVSNREIAKRLGATPGSIHYVVRTKGLQLPAEMEGEITGKNIIKARELILEKRIGKLAKMHENSRDAGWLVGLLYFSGKGTAEDKVYLTTKDAELRRIFGETLRKFTANKIITISTDWRRLPGVFKVTRVEVYDAALAGFLARKTQNILSSWKPLHIPQARIDFWQGVLQGVFDARGKFASAYPRKKAVRLYTAKMPAGAVRVIRFALRRFGIRYRMQGRLSEGEKKDRRKIIIRLNKMEMSGLHLKVRKLDKKLLPPDTERRRFITGKRAPPAIKIIHNTENLKRFYEVINLRNPQLRMELEKVVRD